MTMKVVGPVSEPINISELNSAMAFSLMISKLINHALNGFLCFS